MTNDYKNRIKAAIVHSARLSKKYKTEICDYDQTAVMVNCTDKEHTEICKKLRCSGIYVEKKKVGIVTNFGFYP